jgi:tRNA (guanine-N7-)-methyltransferase
MDQDQPPRRRSPPARRPPQPATPPPRPRRDPSSPSQQSAARSAEGHPPRRIEREFGVPIPGEILDPTQWTQTALKAWPNPGPLDWQSLFGRRAPVVLDIGCGNGRFILGSAWTRRDHDHLGVDTLPVVIRYARRRANQRGLSNVRFAVGGGLELVRDYVPPHSVAEIHVYHPQPYDGPDPALAQRRLFTPEFAMLLHRALQPGGLLVVQTDHPGYWDAIRHIAAGFFHLTERIGPWPDAPRGRTRREIIALRQGLRVYRASGHPRTDLTEQDAAELVRTLPLPVFAPHRRSRALDRLDRGY